MKPLIEPETQFLKFTDDFITTDRDFEEGLLEEGIETIARKYGIGNKVRLLICISDFVVPTNNLNSILNMM